MSLLLKVIFLVLSSLFSEDSVEICDNGVDDNGNGKIDINDEQCFCPPLEPISLIPNPSFEEQNCCPESHSSMNCASGWIQASEATTDYFHTCDWVSSLNIPQPLPHGEGYVGIIDGSFNGDFNPDWKEYVGTCLTDTLRKDSIYRFQFYVGFLDRSTSPEIEIALFGSTSCDNLPFGVGDPEFGCPSNSSDWVRLGAVGTIGENEWRQFSFTLKPNLDITAVAIGPACSHRSYDRNPYHLLDNLVLSKEINFMVDIEEEGFPCDDDFRLSIPAQEGFEYQWYRDGIAIVGATNANLKPLKQRGSYQLRVTNENGCQLSEPYVYRPPFKTSQLSETICRGSAYSFGKRELTTEGVYLDTLTASNNCDSIIRLNLSLSDASEKQVEVKIFPSESYQIGSTTYEIPGTYTQTISSTTGCDSTVLLTLDQYQIYTPNAFSPNDDGRNDVFTIYGASELKQISSLKIFDRWGNLLYEGKELRNGTGWNGKINTAPTNPGIYVYQAVLLMDDEKKRSIQGTFTLVP